MCVWAGGPHTGVHRLTHTHTRTPTLRLVHTRAGRAGRATIGEWKVVVKERAREVADVAEQHPPQGVQPRQVPVLPQRVHVPNPDQAAVGELLERLLLPVEQEERGELRLGVGRVEDEVVEVRCEDQALPEPVDEPVQPLSPRLGPPAQAPDARRARAHGSGPRGRLAR